MDGSDACMLSLPWGESSLAGEEDGREGALGDRAHVGGILGEKRAAIMTLHASLLAPGEAATARAQIRASMCARALSVILRAGAAARGPGPACEALCAWRGLHGAR